MRLAIVIAAALVAATAAHGTTRAGCKWGATASSVGCLAPNQTCTKAHSAAYRRHAYSCVAGRLVYDWSQLRKRPLTSQRVAAGDACPVSPQYGGLEVFGFAQIPAWGSGPVWPFIGDVRSLDVPFAFDPSGDFAVWGTHKDMFAIDPKYVGPVLVRGRQLDGDDVLRFETGEPGFTEAEDQNPLAELRLVGGYIHPAVTRVRTLGCYAWQIDGIGFSRTIVFHAVAGS
jgi:hypothetical protein